MRMIKRGWILALMTIVAGLVALPQAVHASNLGVEAVPLSVIPVQNKYQVNANTGFYDLEMQPGQKTELQMKLANAGAKKLVVKMQAISSTTDSGSHISYTEATKPKDSSLAYPMPSLIKIPKAYEKITIPARTTAMFHMPLTMPKQQFSGIILGSIRVTPLTAVSKKAGIHNTYGYSVAVRLSNGLSQKPNLKLKAVNVARDLSGTYVNATLQNDKASMLRNGKLDTRVTKRGQNRTLKALEVNRASAAPNSSWTVKTPWNGAIAPGDYTMHVTYTTTDPQFSDTKVWRFARNFHISAIQAARYNLAAMNIPWWVYLILAIILVLLIVVIWLLVRRRKEAKRHEEE